MSSSVRACATLVLLAVSSTACTQVRYSRRNPQNGEVWTVYSHTFSDDSVSYCAPPQWGSACVAARELSGPPGYFPSQTYAVPPGGGWAPAPWPPPPPAAGPFRR